MHDRPASAAFCDVRCRTICDRWSQRIAGRSARSMARQVCFAEVEAFGRSPSPRPGPTPAHTARPALLAPRQQRFPRAPSRLGTGGQGRGAGPSSGDATRRSAAVQLPEPCATTPTLVSCVACVAAEGKWKDPAPRGEPLQRRELRPSPRRHGPRRPTPGATGRAYGRAYGHTSARLAEPRRRPAAGGGVPDALKAAIAEAQAELGCARQRPRARRDSDVAMTHGRLR